MKNGDERHQHVVFTPTGALAEKVMVLRKKAMQAKHVQLGILPPRMVTNFI